MTRIQRETADIIRRCLPGAEMRWETGGKHFKVFVTYKGKTIWQPIPIGSKWNPRFGLNLKAKMVKLLKEVA